MDVQTPRVHVVEGCWWGHVVSVSGGESGEGLSLRGPNITGGLLPRLKNRCLARREGT